MEDPKSITEDEHTEFYRFVTGQYDKPRYTLQYKIDVPINLRALIYIPQYKPSEWTVSAMTLIFLFSRWPTDIFDVTQEADVGVALYSRKVLIQAKANQLLPRWLRFVKGTFNKLAEGRRRKAFVCLGVVDSEDIPLNLSRELLQDSNLIRWVLFLISHIIQNELLTPFSAKFDYCWHSASLDIFKNKRRKTKRNIRTSTKITSYSSRRASFEHPIKVKRKTSLNCCDSIRRVKNKDNWLASMNISNGCYPIRNTSTISPVLRVNSARIHRITRRSDRRATKCCSSTNRTMKCYWCSWLSSIRRRWNPSKRNWKPTRKRMTSFSKEVGDRATGNKRYLLPLDTRSLSQDEANALKQWILKQFGDKIKNVKVNPPTYFFLVDDLFRLSRSSDQYQARSASVHHHHEWNGRCSTFLENESFAKR